MNEKKKTKISKFMSLVLRHSPETIGITLDDQGWVAVDKFMAGMAKQGRAITMDELREVVATNSKKRFSFNDDQTKIRASQGHSVEVDLGYEPAIPPDVLYHGTVARFLGAIMSDGLIPGNRHQVHLSKDLATANQVGQRRGKPIILQVDSKRMHQDGFTFNVSANGVWLTDHVPPEYISGDAELPGEVFEP